LGVAFWMLAALPTAAPCATPPEPALRSSEALDVRRLGRVSDDERAVLRVEWRTAQTGSEEASAVQHMLDTLRRMEAAAADIKQLIGNIPAQRPALASIAVESTEVSIPGGKSLALAGGTAAILLSLWWLRRRNPARQAEPEAAANGVAKGRWSPGESPAETEPAEAPPPKTARIDLSATMQLSPARVPATDVYSQTLRLEPQPAAQASAAPPSSTRFPASRPTTRREPNPTEPTTDLPTKVTAVDFSLEDADAEFIARQNARIPVPRRPDSTRRVPERRQELHIEPTLQLAEIMLSMGLQQGAARALVEYIDANPRQAVYHWLKLLGIYRDGGHHKDFVETAGKLRKYFNIQAADAATADAGAAPTLESFPRVADQVRALWSQPKECMAYLQHLLEDNREGSRIGFPQSVAEELLLLIEILKDVSDAGQAAPR
jgi:hypothetical protein